MGKSSVGTEPLPRGLVPVPEGQRAVKVVWGRLNQTMRKFLIARAGVGTDKDAAEIAGTSNVQICQWKKEVPSFGAAYTILMTAPVEFAQGHLRSLAPKLVSTLEDALEGKNLMRDKLKAVELGLRANGLLVTKVDLTHRKLSYEEKLIRHRLENGMSVPEPILRDFVEEGDGCNLYPFGCCQHCVRTAGVWRVEVLARRQCYRVGDGLPGDGLPEWHLFYEFHSHREFYPS